MSAICSIGSWRGSTCLRPWSFFPDACFRGAFTWASCWWWRAPSSRASPCSVTRWVVAGAVVARFSLFGHSLAGTWALGVALVVVALVVRNLLRWPGYAYVQSLVPRLGAAVGIGYLFLLASPELMAALHGWSQPPARQLAAGVLVVAVVWTYGVLEVSRRVDPPPPWRRAYLRTLPVMAMGLAHTLAGMGLLVPLLEALRREAAGAAVAAPLASHDLVLFAVVALALGVVLELAWGERPITEPLG